jgi:hypothetical protein
VIRYCRQQSRRRRRLLLLDECERLNSRTQDARVGRAAGVPLALAPWLLLRKSDHLRSEAGRDRLGRWGEDALVEAGCPA